MTPRDKIEPRNFVHVSWGELLLNDGKLNYYHNHLPHLNFDGWATEITRHLNESEFFALDSGSVDSVCISPN